MKFCKDCKHFEDLFGGNCMRPIEVSERVSPVRGVIPKHTKYRNLPAFGERDETGGCKQKAIFFEPIPKKEAWWKLFISRFKK